VTETKDFEDVGNAGALSGLVVGILGGAKVGFVLIPIPVVGPFTGAVVGGVVGSGVGRVLAQGLVKAGGSVVNAAKVTTQAVLPKPKPAS